MPLVDHDLLTLTEHLSSHPVFSGVGVIWFLVLRVIFCRSLFDLLFLFLLAIVFSVLWLTNSDYPFSYLQTLLPFVCTNNPASPEYKVYLYLLVRYYRAFDSYQDFFGWGFLLTRNLLNQVLIIINSSLEKTHGHHHGLVNPYWISGSKMTMVCFTCHNINLLSWHLTEIVPRVTTTGATTGARTAYLPRVPYIAQSFIGVRDVYFCPIECFPVFSFVLW